MKIEPLETDRIEAIVELSLRAWASVFASIERVMHPDLFRRSYPDGWQASQRQAVHDVCTSGEFEIFTANEGEETFGFAALRLDRKTKMGEIYMIAVDPDRQGRGTASALTDFALTRMKDAGMEVALVETGADPGHEPARRTYEKAKFHPWPTVKYFKYL